MYSFLKGGRGRGCRLWLCVLIIALNSQPEFNFKLMTVKDFLKNLGNGKSLRNGSRGRSSENQAWLLRLFRITYRRISSDSMIYSFNFSCSISSAFIVVVRIAEQPLGIQFQSDLIKMTSI